MCNIVIEKVQDKEVAQVCEWDEEKETKRKEDWDAIR